MFSLDRHNRQARRPSPSYRRSGTGIVLVGAMLTGCGTASHHSTPNPTESKTAVTREVITQNAAVALARLTLRAKPTHTRSVAPADFDISLAKAPYETRKVTTTSAGRTFVARTVFYDAGAGDQSKKVSSVYLYEYAGKPAPGKWPLLEVALKSTGYDYKAQRPTDWYILDSNKEPLQVVDEDYAGQLAVQHSLNPLIESEELSKNYAAEDAVAKNQTAADAETIIAQLDRALVPDIFNAHLS